MKQKALLATLLMLAACTDSGVRNIDYFKIGDFDTREDKSAVVAKLRAVEEVPNAVPSNFHYVNGEDKEGNEINVLFYDDKVVSFSIKLHYEIRTKTAQELQAMEVKYEFDKLRRDSLGECSIYTCVIADYNCDRSIIDDDKCSVVVHSANNGDGWFTKIRWANQAFWKQQTNDYLKSVGKALPS